MTVNLPPTPPPAPVASMPPRRIVSGRLLTAIGALALLAVGMLTKETGFTVAMAILSAAVAWDLANRLERSQPGTEDSPAVPGGFLWVAMAGSVITVVGAGLRLRGTMSIYLGLALALLLIGLWGMAKTGTPGLSAALGRAALIVLLCGFGGGHAVLLRRQPSGDKLTLFLVISVAFFEVASTIFEAARVQLRPAEQRHALAAGTVLCTFFGLVAGTLGFFSPPLAPGTGALIGLCIAAASATGRALPTLFDPDRRDGGFEIAAVTAAFLVAAPVAYYVARVVL